ncbi:MAG: coproporphyrinogen dehydrogenase HemZ [Clostridia bacterium]|nr:coproporphyrinogen dehydrogenase HemZ [Clostridia bacterium]
MILRILGHKFRYECENLCRVFFPNEKIKVIEGPDGDDDILVVTKYENGISSVSVKYYDECIDFKSQSNSDNTELTLAHLIYKCLTSVTGYTPPWGVLTGVRPSKLMTRLISDLGDERANEYFKKDLLVSSAKTDLAYRVAKNEEKIINQSKPDSFSIYISIPYCPSRCSYCSFVSHSIAGPAAKKLFPDYLKYLKKEIEITGDIASKVNLRLESIYFGGGTPGILSAEQFNEIHESIKKSFDLSTLREYTVEVGRPDTVTYEKMDALKNAGVDRISINPQTFNQSTLDTIGRKHSVEETFNAVECARKFNFKCLNMDLIAGLPGEKTEDFIISLDSTVNLSPENITVHSLALKRSSSLNSSGKHVPEGNEASKMLDYTYSCLNKKGYIPYYMYRQSKSVGNLENVGWSKEGFQGLYNVYMMEECHTVLAMGAGGVTKLCEPGGTKVKRVFNYKYPYEYVSGYDTIIKRKSEIMNFYINLEQKDVN